MRSVRPPMNLRVSEDPTEHTLAKSIEIVVYLAITMSNFGFVSFVTSSLCSTFRGRHRSFFSLRVLMFCSRGIRCQLYVHTNLHSSPVLFYSFNCFWTIRAFGGPPLYLLSSAKCIRPIDRLRYIITSYTYIAVPGL